MFTLESLRPGNFIQYGETILTFDDALQARVLKEGKGVKSQVFRSEKIKPLRLTDFLLKKLGFFPRPYDATRWKHLSDENGNFFMLKRIKKGYKPFYYIIKPELRAVVYLHDLQNYYEDCAGKRVNTELNWWDASMDVWGEISGSGDSKRVANKLSFLDFSKIPGQLV
jgi:hypothetical protein